jgi:hypothetical protein
MKSVAISAVGAPLSNAVGNAASSAFGDLAGGFTRNLTQQGVGVAFGRGKIDFAGAAAGALAGALDTRPGATNPVFGAGLGGYVAGQLSSRLIRDAASGGNVDIRRQMADDFGNQLGNWFVGQSMRASQQQAQMAQAYADVRDLEDAQIGRAMRQAEFERAVSDNIDREDAETGLAIRQAEFERTVAENQEREQAEIGLSWRQAEFGRTVAENQEREQAEIGLSWRQAEFEHMVDENMEREQVEIGASWLQADAERVANVPGNVSYYGMTLKDFSDEDSGEYGPGDVLAQNNRPIQLQLRLGNYRPEPSIENLNSGAQIRRLEREIQQYVPGYTYRAVGGNGYTQSDVNTVETVLRQQRSELQGRVNGFFGQLPEGRARDGHTTLAITRAVNPQTGQTFDILTVNGGSQYQREVETMARENGLMYMRAFGNTHAESIGRVAAETNGLVPLVTHTSRTHCPPCMNELRDNGILPGTPGKPRK